MKILLIGNGSSVMDYEAGPVIDSFDVVARFNRFRIKGYENKVGTKTTDWITVDSGTQWMNGKVDECYASDPEVFSTFNNVYIVIPKFKFQQEVNRISSLPYIQDNVQIIDSSVEDMINEKVDFRPAWPTTGLIAITLFSTLYEEIFIHGFDGHDTKYKDYHYFDKNDPMRTTQYAWRENRTDHNLIKEQEYLSKLPTKVKVLSEYL
tara:strand:- start:1050 stop:1670 length:621 start_codon:yes stop_codon:yes gene_type:complete